MLMGGGIGGAIGPMGWNIGGPKPGGAKKGQRRYSVMYPTHLTAT